MEPLEFLSLLWAVDHELHVASKRQRGRLGVTGPQRTAIRLIGREPGIGPGKLATLLRIHPSTLTGILRRLEDNGYVRRTGHADDGRRYVLALTELGAAIDASQKGTIEDFVRTALARATPDQVDAAAAVLDGLAATLREQRA